MTMNKNYEYFYENDTNKSIRKQSTGKHNEFINLLYTIKEETHLTHNVQKSKDLAIHNALGDLYTSMEENLDSFVESVFGIYGPVDLSFSAKNYDNPVEYLFNAYELIEEKRKYFKESFIQSEIDLFQKEIALTLYKLQYVKSN